MTGFEPAAVQFQGWTCRLELQYMLCSGLSFLLFKGYEEVRLLYIQFTQYISLWLEVRPCCCWSVYFVRQYVTGHGSTISVFELPSSYHRHNYHLHYHIIIIIIIIIIIQIIASDLANGKESTS